MCRSSGTAPLLNVLAPDRGLRGLITSLRWLSVTEPIRVLAVTTAMRSESMTKSVVKATTLVTEDGVPIDAVHLPGPRDLAIIVAHGFTLSWGHPRVWRIANRFNLKAGVITFDFRGHGRSGGLSTLGDKEINDLDMAVHYARELGYQKVAAVGFSMGSSVVLRQAALRGGVDAVVSVSGPGRWYYRGTEPMRRVHFVVEKRLGRMIARQFLHTRIDPHGWPVPDPLPPAAAAERIP